MKRAGFTMIELIFVIVILGILSAVAVPKMMGVSEKADAGVCKSFYSSLNRTVGPNLWAEMAIDGASAADTFTKEKIGAQIDLNVKCMADADGTKLAEIATTANKTYDVTIGESTYTVTGTIADASNSPTWKWTKQ